MPHPYVDSATVANNQVTFRVEVSEYSQAKGFVEITGEATQLGGAFAQICATVQVPDAPNGDGDDAGLYFVNVTANAIPPYPFRENRSITVFVRVARVWVTFLDESTGSLTSAVTPAPGDNDNATWDKVTADARVDGSTWPSSAAQSSSAP